MEIIDIRIQNLTDLIRDYSEAGTTAEFVRNTILDASYVSQLLTKRRSLTEKAARKIEKIYGLPSGTLDRPLDEKAAEDHAREMAYQAGPEAVLMLERFLAAPPYMRAGALRFLEVVPENDTPTQLKTHPEPKPAAQKNSSGNTSKTK